jgi:anti-anti-sigma factor
MMIVTKGAREQEKLNDRLKDTLLNYSQEKDRSVEMGLKRVADVPQGVCVALRGRVDTESSKYFARQLQRLVRSCLIRVMLDMRNLTYLSSTGVGELIHFIQEIKRLGGGVVVVDMQPKVRNVIEILGLAGFVGLEHTQEDGAKHLLDQFWK